MKLVIVHLETFLDIDLQLGIKFIKTIGEVFDRQQEECVARSAVEDNAYKNKMISAKSLG